MAQFDETKHRRTQSGQFTFKPHEEADGVSLVANETRWEPPEDFHDAYARLGRLLRPDAPREELVDALHTSSPPDVWRHPNLTAVDVADAAKANGSIWKQVEYLQRMRTTDVPAQDVAVLAVSSQPDWVRFPALAHPNLPDQVRKRVAASPNPKVREALADNPATDSDTLYGYLQEGGSIGFNAARNPNLSEAHMRQALSEGIDAETGRGLAGNVAAPADVLDALTYKGDAHSVAVALNPATSATTLVRLVRDEDWATRAAAVGNPNTPATTTNQIVEDTPNTDGALLREAAKHPGLNRRHLPKAVTHNPRATFAHPNMDAKLAKQLLPKITDEYNPIPRPNSGVTSEVLAVLATSPTPQHRERVANHPTTTNQTLQQLSRDDTNYVRDAASIQLVARGF